MRETQVFLGVVSAAAHIRVRSGLAGITPIIKRIATSSFVLASGGWCLLVFGLSLLVDRCISHKSDSVFSDFRDEFYFYLPVF